jgi:hypothetical protein
MGGDSDSPPVYTGPSAEQQAEMDRIKKQEEDERNKAEADRIKAARSKFSSGGSIPIKQNPSLLGG